MFSLSFFYILNMSRVLCFLITIAPNTAYGKKGGGYTHIRCHPQQINVADNVVPNTALFYYNVVSSNQGSIFILIIVSLHVIVKDSVISLGDRFLADIHWSLGVSEPRAC